MAERRLGLFVTALLLGSLLPPTARAGSACPKELSQRFGAEQAELAAMRQAFSRTVIKTCEESNCTGNFGILFVWSGHLGTKDTFFGCAEWAGRVSTALTGVAGRYWGIRQEQRCWNVPGTDLSVAKCHWVVVADNPRSGQQVVFDGWAERGGWLYPNASPGGGIYPYEAFTTEYSTAQDVIPGFSAAEPTFRCPPASPPDLPPVNGRPVASGSNTGRGSPTTAKQGTATGSGGGGETR